MVRSKLIDLNIDYFYYYSFIISVNRCYGSCGTVEDQFSGICVPEEKEDVNIIVFNMIKQINEQKTLVKHFSYEFRCEPDLRECSSRQKYNNDNCQPIKHCECEEDYVLNHLLANLISIGEYLEDCEY